MNTVGEKFDLEAEEYDSRYVTKADIAEDDLVAKLLVRENISMTRIVDMGCGTGKLLDLIVVDDYTGIDVSGGMLSVARRKFPDRRFLSDRMTNTLLMGNVYDSVVSLYGSPSYDSFTAIVREAHRLLKPGGKVFLMPYAPGRKNVPRPPQAADEARYVRTNDAFLALKDKFTKISIQGLGVPWVHGNDRIPLTALKHLLKTEMDYADPDKSVFLVCVAQKGRKQCT